MSLQVLRAGVEAFSRWRGRLADAACVEAIKGEIENAEGRIAEEKASGKTADRYTFYLYDDYGRVDHYRWSFSVSYIVSPTAKRIERDLTVEWTFARVDGQGEVLGVEGTAMSLADELAEAWQSDLGVEQETGRLYLRSLGRPFEEFLENARSLRKVRRLLAPYVRPLIIVSNETSEDEVLAQLCIHALRCDGLMDESEILTALEAWLARMGSHDPEIVPAAASIIILNWVRPYSHRSFRDYCSRTIRGLIKDRRNVELAERELARKLAAESQLHRLGKQSEGKGTREFGNESEMMTVHEFIRRSGVSKTTAYRWLKEGRVRGKVLESRVESVTALGLNVGVTRRQYEVSAEAMADSERLLKKREIRELLLEVLVKRRKITPRAARAWVRRRVDKGLSLEQISEQAVRSS